MVVVVMVDDCRYNDHSSICVLTVSLNRETPCIYTVHKRSPSKAQHT